MLSHGHRELLLPRCFLHCPTCRSGCRWQQLRAERYRITTTSLLPGAAASSPRGADPHAQHRKGR